MGQKQGARTDTQLLPTSYLGGMDLLAIQEALGHAWVATTMGYVHVHATHVEDAWIAGQERAAMRLAGLAL
jgi:site-specific recombinase XerD